MPPITSRAIDDNQEAYKGFLYIKCEACGKIKGFCSKRPIKYHQCECGHRTELKDLRPAHVRCECCEGNFCYNTNLRTEAFTIACLDCGAPVDMELGAKETAFITIGQKLERGGYNNSRLYMVPGKNHEGYPDPTATTAVANVQREEKE